MTTKRLNIFTTLLFTIIFSQSSFAQTPGLSAHRSEQFSAQGLILFYQSIQLSSQISARGDSASALSSRSQVQQSKWSRAPLMTKAELDSIFKMLRDEKALKDNKKRSRRATWLFPDDGCYARAELMIRLMKEKKLTLPAKIFAFGDLNADTPNHPDGAVNWWYHVAAIVRVEKDYYVIDPSIEAEKPLLAHDWLAKMSNQPQKIDVAVCEPFAYDPNSPCEQKTPDPTHDPIVDENIFLPLEWDRLQDLERSPERELGDFPPWHKQ